MAPSTVDAIILLGWMEREAAVEYLREECVFDPPLTDPQADELWKRYRDRAEELPERTMAPPRQFPLNSAERQHAAKFLSFMQQLGISNIQSVLKINPMQLAVRQYIMVAGRSEEYRARCGDPNVWMEECLPTSIASLPVKVSASQNHMDTAFDIDLPHGEYIFGPAPGGMFAPSQSPRHITITNFGKGMAVWAGYHRLYAQAQTAVQSATEPSALVALISGALVSPAQRSGGGVAGNDAGLHLYGCRPALFSDFFRDGLTIKTKIRKKRFQLQVRSKWVAIDDNH